jgi:hypothetical protein
MQLSSYTRFYILGIALLFFSVKLKSKCDWCAYTMQIAAIISFITGIFLHIKDFHKRKKRKHFE